VRHGGDALPHVHVQAEARLMLSADIAKPMSVLRLETVEP
jgi:hypothetical protein